MAAITPIDAVSNEDFTITPIAAVSDEEQGFSSTITPIEAISDADYAGKSASPGQKAGGYLGGTFRRSIDRGTKQSAGLAGQLLKSVGDATGFAGAIELGDELIREAMVEAISNPARIGGFEDIENVGDAFEFVKQTVGEQIPNLLLAGTGGGIGAFVAKKAVSSALLTNVARKAAEQKAALTGAATGTFGAFLPINTGEMLQEQRDAGIEYPSLGPNLVLGAASSALEVLGFGLIGKAVFGQAKKEVIDHTLGMVLARTGHTTLKALAAEGGTEAVQEAMVIASRKINDPTFSIGTAIASSEGLSRIAFAGVSGAVVGGVLGGAGGVTTGAVQSAQLGMHRAKLKADTLPGVDAIKQLAEADQGEEVTSLIDFGIGWKNVVKVGKETGAAFTEAYRAIKNKLSPENQAAAFKAAEEAQQRATRIMDMEDDILKPGGIAENALQTLRERMNRSIDTLTNTLRQLPVADKASLNKEQNATVHATVKEVSALVEEAKSLDTQGRLKSAEKIVSKVLDKLSQGLARPDSVPVNKLLSALRLARRYVNDGMAAKEKELKKSRSALRILKNKVATEGKALPLPKAAPKMSTPEAETQRSLQAVKNGNKRATFIRGVSSPQQLSTETTSMIARYGLRPRPDPDNNRVVIVRREDMARPLREIEREDFATPIDTIEDPVVVTTRDEAGGVIQNEAVERDPDAVAEAVSRAEQIGETAEVREVDQAVTESIREHNERAKASTLNRLRGRTEHAMIAQVYRAITGWLKKNPRKNITNIPGDLVIFQPGGVAAALGSKSWITWSEFKDAYSDYLELAGYLLDLSNKAADPEAFTASANAALIDDVQSLEDFIQQTLLDPSETFAADVRSREQEANTTYYGVTGNNRIVAVEVQVLEDGTRKVLTKLKLKTPSPNLQGQLQAWADTGEKPAFSTMFQDAFKDAGFAVVEVIDGVPLIRTVFATELNQGRIINQVNKTKQRGNDARFDRLPEGMDKDQALKEGVGGAYVIKAKNRRGETVWFHAGEITELGKMLYPQRTSGIGFVLRDFWEGMAALQGEYDFVIDFNAQVDREKIISGQFSYARMELAAAVNLPTRNAEKREAQLVKDQLAEEFVGATDSEEVGTKNESTLDDTLPDPNIMQKAPGLKQRDQIANSLTNKDGTVWERGKIALSWLVKRFKLTDNIIAFDEDSLPGLIASYEVQRNNAMITGNKRAANVFHDYIKHLQDVQTDLPAGRTIMPLEGTPTSIKAIHVFSKKHKESPIPRSFILAHEFGHIIQRTYLMRLPQDTQAKIIEAMAPYDRDQERASGWEGFANWMAAYAADQIDASQKGIKYKKGFRAQQIKDRILTKNRAELGDVAAKLNEEEQSELKKALAAIVHGLKIVWDQLKVWAAQDKVDINTVPEFADFVAGLNTYLYSESRAPPSDLTPFGQQIFEELRLADAQPIIGTKAERLAAVREKNAQEQRVARARAKVRADKITKAKGLTPLTIEDVIPPKTSVGAVAVPLKQSTVQFEESSESSYLVRTLQNAKGADVTIDFARTATGSGGRYGQTKQSANKAGKTYVNIIVGKDGSFNPQLAAKKIVAMIKGAGLSTASLNIAGHGIYSVGDNQTQVDALVTETLQLVNQELKIKSVRSGGQTGFDEAGAKAGVALGVPTTVLAPKGWKFRPEYRKDISDEQQFKARFEDRTYDHDDMSIEAAEEQANDSVFQSFVTNFQNWAATLKDDPAKAGKMLVYTADSELRGMGAVGTWLAKQFHALPSSTDPSNTVFREIAIRAAPHFKALEGVLNSIPSSRIGLWEMFFNKHPSAATQALRAERKAVTEALLLQTPLNEVDASIRPHVREVRNYLEGLYRWYTGDMNMKLEHRRDYYPMMLDTQVIEQNRGRFIEILRRHGMTEAQAQRERQKLTRDEDGGLNNGFQGEDLSSEFLGPGATFKKARADRDLWSDALRAELVAEGFYQQDIATTLIAYTEMMTRRAVWERRFRSKVRKPTRAQIQEYEDYDLNINHPVAALQLKLVKAHERGDLNDWQYRRINEDILPAYAGQLGLRTNSHIRKLSAGVVIYQNLRLLGFAIFSQFVDVGTLAARGDFKSTQAAMRMLMSKTSRDNAKEMLQAIGAMRQGLTEHVLNDQALNTFMTGKAKRINDLFFRYNGMEGWTNLMRTMGLVSAREFMQRNAQKALAGDANAIRYLQELDITPAEIVAWDGHSTGNLRINAALNRYIDEAMIRPDASIRPVWMSDPGYGVFAHLKGFLYGFHETFLRRVGREAKIHQNLLPLLALGMLALPFAAVGYELRRKILGTSKNAPEGVGYMKELVERAGLFGAWQLVVDMEQADEYGKPFALGVGGPAVEQLFTFFDSDMSSWVPKAIPVVASVPAMREWVRDELSD